MYTQNQIAVLILGLCFILFAAAIIWGVELVIKHRLDKNDRYVWKFGLYRPPGSKIMLLGSRKVRK
jgi:hypothetical protein